MRYLLVLYRVSSVLNDEQQFGKRHLIDGKENTCWNSDAGKIQFIVLKFQRKVDVSRLELTFQGGFAPRLMSVIPGYVENSTIKYELEKGSRYTISDHNSMQSFRMSLNEVEVLRLVFSDMSDDFGRVIVYRLDVLGTVSSSAQTGESLSASAKIEQKQSNEKEAGTG